jgi:hypothetical protein
MRIFTTNCGPKIIASAMAIKGKNCLNTSCRLGPGSENGSVPPIYAPKYTNGKPPDIGTIIAKKRAVENPFVRSISTDAVNARRNIQIQANDFCRAGANSRKNVNMIVIGGTAASKPCNRSLQAILYYKYVSANGIIYTWTSYIQLLFLIIV